MTKRIGIFMLTGALCLLLSGKTVSAEDEVIKRTPKLEMYRCSECHSSPADYNKKPRELTEEHLEKKVHFREEKDDRWCHSCHQLGDYHQLHLQSGHTVSLNEGYFLCGECHAVVFDDWKKNIHGKRVGSWNGKKEIFSCMECHDPHDPQYKPMEAVAKPHPPRSSGNFFKGIPFLGEPLHE